MKRILFLATAVVMIGCGPRLGGDEAGFTRMREKAPKYTQGKVGDFIDGYWSEAIDFDEGEKARLHVDSIDEVPITETYYFSKDGTFWIKKQGHKVGGTWADADGIIVLSYVTLDDKPWNDGLADIQKGAERGSQAGLANDLTFDWLNKDLQKLTKLTLHEDKQRLSFAPSAPPPAEGLGGLALINIPLLERLKKG